jgi:predicted ribosomally synthesized peptide with nif11-like leader
MGDEFHQQAADEVGSNLLGGAGEEGLGQGWEVLDRRGGYGGGWVRKCPGMLTGLMGWASNGELLQFHAMSEEQLTALLSKLKEDAGLKDKFRHSDLDAAVVMAQEAGFDVSKADWIRYKAKQTLELSDEQLEAVAGGLDTEAPKLLCQDIDFD